MIHTISLNSNSIYSASISRNGPMAAWRWPQAAPNAPQARATQADQTVYLAVRPGLHLKVASSMINAGRIDTDLCIYISIYL